MNRRDFLKLMGGAMGTIAASAVISPDGLAFSETAQATSGTQGASYTPSLPKGGGAIQSIGETFSASPFTGTGNFSVPIAASPGRAGFGPQLTLQYSTGNGNGPFGLGWQLSIPRVTRKTEKGLPRYRDCDLPTLGTNPDTVDCDVFVLPGAEDLAPFLENVNGQWQQHERSRTVDGIIYRVLRYRPRTETFDRIEKWQNGTDVHWRATTKENVTSVYGRTDQARIFDPDRSSHIFEWLLEETFDAKGNHIRYEYAQEQKQPNVAWLRQSEEKRSYSSQRYIRRILYGNLPIHDDPTPQSLSAVAVPQRDGSHYLFELLFDYADLPADPGAAYVAKNTGTSSENFISDENLRADPFSTYRAGFEIRTLRRCQRVLMVHHFPELAEAGKPATALVKATEFTYRQDPNTQISLLQAATVKGYRWDPDKWDYTVAAMPPITFGYSEFALNTRSIQTLEGQGNQLPAVSLRNANLTLVDLHGNGLLDFLYADSMQVRYWQNLGNGQFSRPRRMTQIPANLNLSAPGVSFTDMGGDGRVDLLINNGVQQVIYESTGDAAWKPPRPTRNLTTTMTDPNLRQVDLTGDGRPDLMLTYDEHFLWYRSLGEKGYAEAEVRSRLYNIESYPDVYFNDSSGRIRMADMNGDGLTDIVEIHNGRVRYWPNLGYGFYGTAVAMNDAPHFGYGFDPARLFLVDIDGSGCSDIAYVDDGAILFWFNQSGNGWSEPMVITGLRFNNATNIQFTDIFGNGTACLLWSTDLSRRLQHNYKVLDLCAGVKPLLLTEMSNNMGATTQVKYGTSSQHWLRDNKQNEPWATPLPFPVQVVDKVEVIDHISKTKLVTTYAYHHGYFDGDEREFRGFGRVDQLDTETFADFSQPGLHGAEVEVANAEKAFYAPPALTKNWYHTGAYMDEQTLMAGYRAEFWQEDKGAFVLADHDVPPNRAAHRALRGSLLRMELYAQDGTEKAQQPYTVTENRYQVEERQAQRPAGSTLQMPHAVYETRLLETMSYHYERNPQDPRIAHEMTLAVDKFGNVTDRISIAYPRCAVPDNLPEQGKILALYTKANYINTPELTDPSEELDYYYIGLPYQTRTYEVTGLRWPPDRSERQFKLADFNALIAPDGDEQTEESYSPPKRLLKWNRTYYRPDAEAATLDGSRLALGKVESLALPYESYQAALTNELIGSVFVKKEDAPSLITDDMLTAAKYHQEPGADGYWWVPSGRQAFAPAQFYLPYKSSDPFGNISTIDYDDYGLLVTQTTDPLGNRILAQNDYRVLQPHTLTDPNGNRSAVAFDALGMVVGTAVMGKVDEEVGDRLDGFAADPPLADLQRFIANPQAEAASLLGKATTRIVYDLGRFQRTGQPLFAATLARETHSADPGGEETKIQVSFAYSDGFGREIQKKIQAEAGDAPQRLADVTLPDGDGDIRPGNLRRDAAGKPLQAHTAKRWVGTGRTVFNNKGKPVKQYEPFFSSTHLYESEHEMTDAGVSPILFYDPLERVVATLHPNHTWEKVDFDAWHQTTWDVNDTVMVDPLQDEHIQGFLVKNDGTLGLVQSEYIPSWYALRTAPQYVDERIKHWPDPKTRAAQARAAQQAKAHADTPTTAHFDTLGRPVLTVADNGPDPDAPKEHLLYTTRVELDIEGNQRAVTDAKGRLVMQYAYDLLGNRIHQDSMEAGARWMLNDVTGKPIRAWDSRGHIFTTTYDALRRPVGQYVRGTTDDSDPRTRNAANARDLLVDKIEYGEGIANAEALNLRTRIYRHFDAAGVIINARLDAHDNPVEAYDFKGNLLRSTRRLTTRYQEIPNWSQNPQPQLAAERFEASTRYDALNRPIQSIAPHSSLPGAKRNVIQPVFNEATLLEWVDVWLERLEEPEQLLDQSQERPSPVGVANINYNAKGQRQQIDYKNGVSTLYEYDPLTFRLTHLLTWRNAAEFPLDCPQPPPEDWPGCQVQNLHYIYDPAGNITHIRDNAQQTIYFRNQRVEPSSDYTYDALYRLIQATGREHLGQQANGNRKPPTAPDAFNAFHTNLDHPGNGEAMGTYIESYVYDAVGNFLQMQHSGSDPAHAGRTRTYVYREASQLEPSKASNRLTSTTIHGDLEAYSTNGDGYDAHGNMLRLPHLQTMQWDYKDQLQMTQSQKVNGTEEEDDQACQGERTYYVYDASGQRVRKVTEKADGGLKAERIYLGGFEIYRQHTGQYAGLVRETLHIMDDKQRIALVETRNEVDDGTDEQLIRYQIGNHLGSASLELNEQAKIISYEEYFPYGSTSYQAVNKEMKAAAKRYRYTGKERDKESGLYYHGARYYAPWLGRWTNCDPMLIDSGFEHLYQRKNPYEYVLDNPIIFSDPDGRTERQFFIHMSAPSKPQKFKNKGQKKQYDKRKEEYKRETKYFKNTLEKKGYENIEFSNLDDLLVQLSDKLKPSLSQNLKNIQPLKILMLTHGGHSTQNPTEVYLKLSYEPGNKWWTEADLADYVTEKRFDFSLRELQNYLSKRGTQIDLVACNIAKSTEFDVKLANFFGGSGVTVRGAENRAQLLPNSRLQLQLGNGKWVDYGTPAAESVLKPVKGKETLMPNKMDTSPPPWKPQPERELEVFPSR